jgi:GTPase SAR1 family protein
MWCCNAPGNTSSWEDDTVSKGRNGYEEPNGSNQALRGVGELANAPPPSGRPMSQDGAQDEAWAFNIWTKKPPGRDFDSVATGLQTLYRDKLLPIELDSDFHHFHQPEIPPAYFSSRPLILTIGQYSTGKTTFIQHLLGHDYPNAQIGPEPTTDRFVAVCHGNEAQIIPGNALVYDRTLPFTPLSVFGNSFLSRLECARMPNPILEGVSFVDTPGVLSGEKQRLKRGYDFEEVMTWFSDHAAMIILFFDAHKLDVSDELKRCVTVLAGNSAKVHVILNKADRVTTQELLRVNGALMWSLGKVMDTPEVTRVYVGSFWDEPLQNDELRSLFEREQDDLYRHIEQLPRSSSVQKINDLSKRARLAKAHALLLEYLRNQMPTMWGHAEKQSELIENLSMVYHQVARENQIPLGDFPSMELVRQKLSNVDLSRVKRLDYTKMRNVDSLLHHGIPELLSMVPAEQRRR